MIKKIKKFVKKNKYLVIVSLLIVSFLLIGGAAKANSNWWIGLRNYVGDGIIKQINIPKELTETEDIIVGAFPGPDLYEEIRFHNGFTGASLNIPIRYPSATNTAMTDLVLGTYYFPEDVFLYDWGWAITEQNDDSGFGDFGIGTTTLTSGSRFEPGVSSLTNTTTRTIVANSEIATGTDKLSFDVWGYADQIYAGSGAEGNEATSTLGSFFDGLGERTRRISTTSPLFISAGTLLVISAGGDGGATSSGALLTGDASNFKGMFYGSVIYQEQN